MPEPAPTVSLAAGPAHRRGVVGLLAGLALFVLVYLALLIGCVAAIVVAVDVALREPWVWPIAIAGAALFLPLLGFLVHGLLRDPAPTTTAIALAADEEPELFRYLEDLARAAGTPMPARVCVSAGVNASMVRGHSAIGSVLGGRRELAIGLGLVNVLDRRELEAVLAHEFGHFAQSSTRVGQWAHRVAIVARGVVFERTRFDARLLRLRTRGPIVARGAASVLSVGVSGARRILAALLTRVTRSSLALARELEFNADLHAVALCGSDPLVAALWRAQRGALAMNAALGALAELAKHGLFSEDLYVHHARRLGELDDQLEQRDDPMSRALRAPYRYGPKLHFPPGEAPAEVMAYAHPTYREREANAKREYVPPVSGTQERVESAWSLFADAPGLRRALTRKAYARLGLRPDPDALRPAQEVELALAEELAERRQAPGHHGFYRNRIIDPGPIEAVLGELEACELGERAREVIEAEAQAWRGASLAAFMASWRETEAALEQRRGPDPELDRRRVEELARAHQGDRAIVRYMWLHASAEQRAELGERHRFLAFVQRGVLALNEHHARLGQLLTRVDVREYELASDVPGPVREALELVHRDLDAILDEAATVALPPLRNLEAGRDLASVLLDGPRVPALERDVPLGPWLQAFTARISAVHGRLRTLHFKNLGRLLALYEQISPASEETAR